MPPRKPRVCSDPGCKGRPAAEVISPSTVRYKGPVLEGGGPLKAPGRICLDHLLRWWPAQRKPWLRDWLERQQERAVILEAATLRDYDARVPSEQKRARVSAVRPWERPKGETA